MAAFVLLAVTAGGGYSEGDTMDGQDAPTTSSSGDASSPGAPSGSTEPDVGDGPMTVGQVRQDDAYVTSLEEIRHPYPTVRSREPERAGQQFLGLRVRQCLLKDTPTSPDWDYYSTSNGEWAAVGPKGRQVVGTGSYWPDWPIPKFPENVTMNPGDCLKGWLVLEVPRSMPVARVIWRSGGAMTAERLP